jgi:hypothetical protein
MFLNFEPRQSRAVLNQIQPIKSNFPADFGRLKSVITIQFVVLRLGKEFGVYIGIDDYFIALLYENRSVDRLPTVH